MKVKVRAVLLHDGRLVISREQRQGVEHVSLPGGRVRDGEPITQALIREVKEETGLRVMPLRLLYVAEVVGMYGVHDLNLVWLVELSGGPPGGRREAAVPARRIARRRDDAAAGRADRRGRGRRLARDCVMAGQCATGSAVVGLREPGVLAQPWRDQQERDERCAAGTAGRARAGLPAHFEPGPPAA